MKNIKSYFPNSISKKQASDTALAIILILLFIGLYTHDTIYFKIAVPVLLINMISPMFYYGFAIIWLGLSNLVGSIISKVLLTIIYVFMIVPVGLFRKILGKDSLQLFDFKKSSKSVMESRNHVFTSRDIENPY